MKFEIGKFYRHTTGKDLAIIGELETTMFGKTLIAETKDITECLMAVGRQESATANYTEITKEEWMKNFSKD